MSIDRTGIENDGEFFSAHYFAERIDADLEPLKKAWNAMGAAAPPNRLRALSAKLFRAAGEADTATSHPARRYELAQDVHAELCELLGYARHSEKGSVLAHVLSDGTMVPLLARAGVGKDGVPTAIVLEGRFRQPDGQGVLDMGILDTPALKILAEHGNKPVSVGSTYGELISRVFEAEDAPRWVLLLSGSDVVLLANLILLRLAHRAILRVWAATLPRRLSVGPGPGDIDRCAASRLSISSSERAAPARATEPRRPPHKFLQKRYREPALAGGGEDSPENPAVRSPKTTPAGDGGAFGAPVVDVGGEGIVGRSCASS